MDSVLVQFGNPFKRFMQILKYRSGEEIRKGDRVLFHGEPGQVELVATDPSNPEGDWYVSEFGGGVMILAPKRFGRAFICADTIDYCEDLEFVSRAETI